MQMAASFALGAAGIVLGTRLNATYESVYPEAKKQALVKAGSSASSQPSTIRTTLYDELSGVAWPPAVDGNCLRNELTAQYSSQTPLQVTQWHTLIRTPVECSAMHCIKLAKRRPKMTHNLCQQHMHHSSLHRAGTLQVLRSIHA